MTLTLKSLVAASALATLGGLTLPAHAVTFNSFSFGSQASTSGLFGGVNGIWGNGDVRLDTVTFAGNSYGSSSIQTASNVRIVLDDGIDLVNGGGNLAAGRGVNASADAWAPEGPATVTPGSADLLSALANRNLTSLVVTRENVGSAVIDVHFSAPTNDLLFFERGANSDLQVQALNAADQVIGTYTILRSAWQATGIIVSTDNGAFVLAGQELGAIGLHSDEAISRLRLSSYRSDLLNFNGPDYKVLAVSPVPEPGSWAMLLAGLGAAAFIRRRAGLGGA